MEPVGAFCRPAPHSTVADPAQAVYTGGAADTTSGGYGSYNSANSSQILPDVSEIESQTSWRCTLHCQGGSAQADLELSAYLAGCDGLALGHVNSQAGEVVLQFQECGVHHVGASVALGGGHSETIRIDLSKLSQNDIFRYIFIRSGLRAGSVAPGSVTTATLALLNGLDQRAFTEVDIAGFPELLSASGNIVICLIRDRSSWYAIPTSWPCMASASNEAQVQDMLMVLARKADCQLKNFLEKRAEEEEAAAAIAAVAATEA